MEQATVYSRKKNRYFIKLTKSAKCDGCKACGFGRKNYVILPAISEVECNTGDCVEVEMPEKSVKGAYVFLFLLSLLFMFVCLMIPYGHGEIYMFIGGIIGLVISIPVIYAIERLYRRQKKYLPKIISKISVTEEKNND